MEKFDWIEKYSVGVRSIDEQHQHYFEIANDAIKMTGQSNISAEDVMAKINDLNNYAIYHFTTEENLFKRFAYPDMTEHLAAHRTYEEKMDAFITEARKENVDVKKTVLQIAEFAGSWLVNHIMDTDQKYIDFMRKNGIK
jgi:hemerythrin